MKFTLTSEDGDMQTYVSSQLDCNGFAYRLVIDILKGSKIHRAELRAVSMELGKEVLLPGDAGEMSQDEIDRQFAVEMTDRARCVLLWSFYSANRKRLLRIARGRATQFALSDVFTDCLNEVQNESGHTGWDLINGNWLSAKGETR